MPELVPYRTEREIEDVVERFETCAYNPEEFVHARHLTVAAWYCLRFGGASGAERMRDRLRKFIRFHGKNGYHETITAFWLALVEASAAELADGHSAVEVVNEIVGRLGDKNLIYDYYSKALVESSGAKASPLPPDLKPISWREPEQADR